MDTPLATFYRQKTGGVAYWRAHVPARHLPAMVQQLEADDLAPDPDGNPFFPNHQGDTAIWLHPGNTVYSQLIEYQMQLGYRALVEVDDNYLTRATGQQYGDWQDDFDPKGLKHSNAEHRLIASFVDGIICSTERLAAMYEHVNEHLYVCRNSVDPADWPEQPPERDGPLRILWAASHSHYVDAPMVRRAMEWAARQPNVEVILFGYQPPWRGPFKRVYWTDSIAEYRAALAALAPDVAICPLLGNDWANCKSDVKALEAAMVGAMPVVSRVEPYRDWHERTLAVPPVVKDWERALKWCVAHQDEVRERAREAREYVMQERTIHKQIGSWREAVAVQEERAA